MEPLLEKLLACELHTQDDPKSIPPCQGIYVFYEKGKPIYVGRTKNMRKRIRGYIAPSAGATFAIKLLRENVDIQTDYSTENSTATLLKRFPKEFGEQRDKVKCMLVRFVEIEDVNVQYIFEVYATLALGTTRYNTFYPT